MTLQILSVDEATERYLAGQAAQEETPAPEEEPKEAGVEEQEGDAEGQEQEVAPTEEGEKEEEEPAKVKLSIDGVEQELPVEELAASIKAAKEYQVKQQELTQYTEALTAAVTHYKGVLAQETQNLDLLMQSFSRPVATDEQIAELYKTGDIEQAARLEFEEKQRLKQLDALKAAHKQTLDKQAEINAQELQHVLKINTQLLHKHGSHLKDVNGKQALVRFLTDEWHQDPAMRFTAQEIDQAVDARLIVMADKLRQLTEAQKARPKPASNLPKVSTSAAKPIIESRDQKALASSEERLRKTGKTDDAVAVYLQRQQFKKGA